MAKKDEYVQSLKNKERTMHGDIKRLEEKLKATPAQVFAPNSGASGPFGSKSSFSTFQPNPAYQTITNQINELKKQKDEIFKGPAYEEGLRNAEREDLGSDKKGVTDQLEKEGLATVDKIQSEADKAQATLDRLANDPEFDPSSTTNKAFVDNLNFIVDQGETQIKRNEQLRNLYGPNYANEITAARNQGIADAGTLSSIGARATANQLGVGGPTTLGQQQTLYAANQQMGGQAFQQGQQYAQNLQNQNLDYQKYFADKQMQTSNSYRNLGLAVGKEEAANKFNVLGGLAREGRDVNSAISQFGLNVKSGVAGERINQLNQKIGGIDYKDQKDLTREGFQAQKEGVNAQLQMARDANTASKWGSLGQIFGTLGGAAIGSTFGPAGTAAGAAIGSSVGGGGGRLFAN